MSEPTPSHGANQQTSRPWGALLRVITEPTATFQALAERPAILPPYLLQMVAGLISMLLVMPLTTAAVAEQLAKTPNAAGAAAVARVVSMVTLLLSALAGPWVVGAITALIASFFAQFQGGSLGFRTYLSMVGYARVPLAVGGLIHSWLMSTASSLQQAQSMSLSLAAFAPDGTNPLVKAFLATLNPFDLVYYGLLAIGFAALQRVKAGKGTSFAVVLYAIGLLMALIGAAFAKSRGL